VLSLTEDIPERKRMDEGREGNEDGRDGCCQDLQYVSEDEEVHEESRTETKRRGRLRSR
jgi:hypothetical protein